MLNAKGSVGVTLLDEYLKNSKKTRSRSLYIEAGSMDGKKEWDAVNSVGEHLRRFSRQRRRRQSGRDDVIETVPKMGVSVRCTGRKHA